MGLVWEARESVEAMVADISFGNLFADEPHIVTGVLGDGSYVQVVAHDSFGDPQAGRKWYISSHACRNEVVQTCLRAWLDWLEHEGRETIRYRGQLVNGGPHVDPDWMAVAQEQNIAVHDVRSDR